MKPLPIDMRVLLIQAPVQHPAGGSQIMAAVYRELAPITDDVCIFDAGSDFFRQVVMNPDHILSTADLKAAGGSQGLPTEVNEAASAGDRNTGIGAAAGRIAALDMPEVPWRLQSADWQRPENMIGDLAMLDLALDLISETCPPCRFHRQGFAHPGLNSVEDLIAFRDNPVANPFFDYAFRQWRPFPPDREPHAAVLCVSTAGQIPAAATMAHAWHRRWPDIPLVAVGPGVLTDEAYKILFFEDRLARNSDDGRRLADRLQAVQAEDSAPASDGGPIMWPSGLAAMRLEPLERRLIIDQIPVIGQAAAAEGRKMIIWRPVDDEVGFAARQLHAVARQGIWNHLILTGGPGSVWETFALANPNIVHSWCRMEPALSPFSDPIRRYPEASTAYGETAPLPGKPLWMTLRDPVYIEAALERIDLGSLMRLRIGEDGCSLFEVGRNLRFHFVPPRDLPPGYLEEIVRMVAAGGSVDTRFVKHNLERAHLIAYVEEQGVIIGNSSLKHPREEYIDAVSRQSGIDLHDFLERGYTSVRPDYRGLGIGARLLAGLTERAGERKIFSVIAEQNIATQKMAIRNRTRRVATFFSQRANKQVGVWIPEWMLPEGIQLPEQPDVDGKESV